MAANDEPKMTELKRLLRRLDGLDARSNAGKSADAVDAERRDYVGTLRGAPEFEDGKRSKSAAAPVTVSPRSAALLGGAVAAAFSTALVYVFMSAEQRSPLPHSARPSGADHSTPGAQPAAKPAPTSGDRDEISRELVRSAAVLLENGNVDGARELLRRAAELGSGPAALELARTFDPERSTTSPPENRNANSALARAWYERARELGVAEVDAQRRGEPGR